MDRACMSASVFTARSLQQKEVGDQLKARLRQSNTSPGFAAAKL